MSDKQEGAQGFDDRELAGAEKDETSLPKPQIEIIVDGNTVFKPGMKTFFVNEEGDLPENVETGEAAASIMGTYCTCDTVTVPYRVCTCQDVCSCDGYHKTTGTAIPGVPTAPQTTQICSCQSVSCGAPCACVPVH